MFSKGKKFTPKGPKKTVICFGCRSEGHYKYQCPKKNKKKQGKPPSDSVNLANGSVNSSGIAGSVSMAVDGMSASLGESEVCLISTESETQSSVYRCKPRLVH